MADDPPDMAAELMRAEIIVATLENTYKEVYDNLRALGADPRWLAIAWTDLQTSHMALLRAISERV